MKSSGSGLCLFGGIQVFGVAYRFLSIRGVPKSASFVNLAWGPGTAAVGDWRPFCQLGTFCRSWAALDCQFGGLILPCLERLVGAGVLLPCLGFLVDAQASLVSAWAFACVPFGVFGSQAGDHTPCRARSDPRFSGGCTRQGEGHLGHEGDYRRPRDRVQKGMAQVPMSRWQVILSCLKSSCHVLDPC